MSTKRKKPKDSIATKLVLMMLFTSILSGTLVLGVAIVEESRNMEEHLVQENVRLAMVAAQSIEEGHSVHTWPFKTLKQINESENVLFWWVVKPDGEIYLADDPNTWGKKVENIPLGVNEMLIMHYLYPGTNEEIKLVIYPLTLGEPENSWVLCLGITLKSIDKARNEMIVTSLLFFGVIVLVAVLVSIYLARGFTKPLADLAGGVKALSEGKLDHRVPIRTRDEIGVLGSFFNKMAEDLERSQREIEKYSRNLEEKVKERTEELELSNKKLKSSIEELERTQSQLIQSEKLASVGTLASGIAHEINNPLTVVTGYGEAILDKANSTLIGNYATKILSAAERASEVVRWLSKYSRQAKDAKIVDIDLNVVLRDSLDTMKLARSSANIEVVTDFGEIPCVRGNLNELQQIFVNLLNNSADAMSEGGEVLISTRSTGELVEIEISDSGVGISKEHLAQIFDPFFTTKEVGQGTGLGLYVVSMIMRRHRGTIDVNSEVGKGTTFCLRFPTAEYLANLRSNSVAEENRD